MEDHKSEIENWDLGAGIFISFYTLKSSLKEDDDTMTELVCNSFKYMRNCLELSQAQLLVQWTSFFSLIYLLLYNCSFIILSS